MPANVIEYDLIDRPVGEENFIWQYDFGQKIQFKNIDLPFSYEVHFANKSIGPAEKQLGDASGVVIPYNVTKTGKPVYFWLYVTGENKSITIYGNHVPVRARASVPTTEPTPEEQSFIEQALGVINDAMEVVQEIPDMVIAEIEKAIEEGKIKGDPGAVFTPHITDGVMTWTNNGDLPNPDPTDFNQQLGLNNFATKQELSGKIDTAQIGSANGVAGLDASGRVPSEQLPSYVDDVLEFASLSMFPMPGESGKIYISLSNNHQYRWTGTQYIDITSGDLETRKADKRDTVLETTLSRGRVAGSNVGAASIAFGSNNAASGEVSQAFGSGTNASGFASHAEGAGTTASGSNSHAEGNNTRANGAISHAEGLGGSFTRNGTQYQSGAGNYAHSEGDVTVASGDGAHSEGSQTLATGNFAHAEGYNTNATNTGDHAEGYGTTASGMYSHAEGNNSAATAYQAHAEGLNTSATASQAHAEGLNTRADGIQSHAEGTGGTFYINDVPYVSSAYGANSHAEGDKTRSEGNASHTEGTYTVATGDSSHAEGNSTKATAQYAHAEGYNTVASGYSGSHAEGANTTASDDSAHAEGSGTNASNNAAHAEGASTIASGEFSHAEGSGSTASGEISHAEGSGSTASGDISHAEGSGSTASGDYSHAEGASTIASGNFSHAEGAGTRATNSYAHAEGAGSQATGQYAHAEGASTQANAYASHSEGSGAQANGSYAHAEGGGTQANGYASHSEGELTVASGKNSHVGGMYNVIDSYANWTEWTPGEHCVPGDKRKRTRLVDEQTVVEGYICKTENTDSGWTASHWTDQAGKMNYVEIVGNGTADDARSNARVLDWEGNERLMGDVYVGCNPDSTGGTKLEPVTYMTLADAQAIIDGYGVSA